MVFYDMFSKPKQWINVKTRERALKLDDSEDELLVSECKGLIEIEREEQSYADEVSLFDYLALTIGVFCLALNIAGYFHEIDLRFTSLS